MANPTRRLKDIDPSESSRAFYGAELRFKRQQAGLSRTELADRLFVSSSNVASLGSGRRRMQPDIATMLDEILQTDGFFVRNLAAGRSSPHPDFFADIAELETVAVSIHGWQPLLFPGLLQTEAYARAVIRGWDPVLPEEAVRQRLDARLGRARLFDDAEQPLYWAVINEPALRCPVGGSASMAGQLRHVAALAHRNRIVLQALPLATGAHAGLEGALKLMTFEHDTPLAYLPGVAAGTVVDDPATVKCYSLAYDLLAAAALPPDASLDLIEAAAEEYDHGVHVRLDGGGVA